MSHFICDKCGAECIDSPKGYIRGCVHYPSEIYDRRETALSRLQARMRKIERETNSRRGKTNEQTTGVQRSN
jgi:hypothetical protein